MHLVDSENWADESTTKRQAIKWLERIQTSTVTPKQQAIHDEYLELTIADEIVVLEAKPSLFYFEEEMLKALKNPETAAEQELRNDHGEFLIANEIAALEARQDLNAFQVEVLEALKAVQAEAIQIINIQVISRYEKRVQQQRVEQQRIAEQERLRQENEKREAEEKRQQEIISKYGSLEAYRRHQNIESFVGPFLTLFFFLGVPILLVFLFDSC